MSVDSDPRCEQVSRSTFSSTTPASVKLTSEETIPISSVPITTAASITAVPTAMMPTITPISLSTNTEAIPAKQSCDDSKYVQQMSDNQTMIAFIIIVRTNY